MTTSTASRKTFAEPPQRPWRLGQLSVPRLGRGDGACVGNRQPGQECAEVGEGLKGHGARLGS